MINEEEDDGGGGGAKDGEKPRIIF